VNGIAILVAAALAFGLGALIVLLWALNSGQYDDLDGAANRILLKDDQDT
jgi:cbb3-type cytochrome oxidase maturation protein